jgi:pilus assembly protein CpaE
MIACVVHPGAANPTVNALRQFLGRLGYVVVVVDSFEAAAAEPTLQKGGDNIILAPTTPDWRPEATSVVDLAKVVEGRAFVIYICDEIRPEDYKALLRTGAGECVDWANAPKEISAIGKRLRGASSSMPSQYAEDLSKHIIVGMVPACGGAGNTTLALESGVHFARQKGKDARRPGVVELDFNHATICDYVDLAPRLDIVELARNPGRLDDYMLDIFRSNHSSGLDLFSAAEPPADCASIDGAAVFALLNKLHDRYQILLLDFPDYRPSWGDDALRNCDFVFVTARRSVPSLKQAARELKRLRNLGFAQERVAAVVTHCQAGLFGGITSKLDIETALPGYRVFYIRDDSAFATESVNSGVSMMEARASRGICRDIQAVAAFIRTLAPREVA